MTEEQTRRLRGTCKEAAEEAAAQDPELRVVRGHYYDPMWGEQAHWWCERPDGEIVDPTKDQFPSRGAGVYVEFSGFLECEICGREIAEKDAIGMGNHGVCSESCAMRLVGL